MDKVLMMLRNDHELDISSFTSDKFNVEVYTDVVLALHHIKDVRPKILIIDFATSRISGLELIRIIRSNPFNYHTKIVITARNFNYKYLKLAFDYGADYFVKFPFNIKEIEKIYNGLKNLSEYADIENIVATNEFDWVIGI